MAQDPISRLELIHGGATWRTIECTDRHTQEHTVELTVQEPGWYLVRAVADVERTFRFATTAPWFVEVGDVQHRISRRSVRFFLDWVDQRMERVTANVPDAAERAPVLVWHQKARDFWTARLGMANAE